MGANAVLQMAKAGALVEEYLSGDGMQAWFVPARTTIVAGSGAATEERTAMRMVFFVATK
jgi:stage V sporulation protein SpoVS